MKYQNSEGLVMNTMNDWVLGEFAVGHIAVRHLALGKFRRKDTSS